ncbi:MAG: TIR domain-containing protein [Bacteroidota bacterium]
MQRLDVLEVNYQGKAKTIELYHGDLTNLNRRDYFDMLVTSAFPNDYIPTRTSLIGALFRKGVSVANLAANKEEDLRDIFSCWLSKPLIPEDYQGIQFSRILCFEPLGVDRNPPALIGHIFQALLPMTEQYDIKSIGMPILTTGDQNYPVERVLPILIEAAVNWLNIGLDLDTIKIVTYSAEQATLASKIFKELKHQYGVHFKPESSAHTYDYFISYSHDNEDMAAALYDALRKKNANFSIFFDKKSLQTGHAWQQELFEALDDSQYVYTLLSPQYLASKVCLEEYHIAHFRNRESDTAVLKPIYLYSAPLPSYMKLVQFIDCREGALDKLNHINL